MLPFLFGMLAPTLLPSMAPWLAGGLGALAGDVIDDGDINPMNVLMGGLGGGLASGGLGPLFGGTSGAAGAAAAGAPLANPGILASNPGMVGQAASAGGAAAGGLGGLMSNPGMLMGGAALLSGMGGLEGGKPEKGSRTWRAQAPAPRPNSIAAPAPPTTVSTERNYGIQAPTIDEARDRYLADTAGARYVPRYAEGGDVEGSGVWGMLANSMGAKGSKPDSYTPARPSATVVQPPSNMAPVGQSLGNRSYLSSRPAMMPYDTNRIGGASANARMIQRGYDAGFGPRGLRTAGIAALPQTGSQRYIPEEYRSPVQQQVPSGKTSRIQARRGYAGGAEVEPPKAEAGDMIMAYLSALGAPFNSPALEETMGSQLSGAYGQAAGRAVGTANALLDEDRRGLPYALAMKSRMKGYAEGGEVGAALDTSMPEVQNAIAAIMGDPNVDPQQAMGALYAKLRDQYGEEQADQMIKELVAMVEGSRAPDRRVPEAGGPDGMADDQMAMVDGQEPARINSGEVVVSKPTLSAMGSGDPDKGADKLLAFMDDVRKEHYGRKEHPDRVDFEGMAARLA